MAYLHWSILNLVTLPESLWSRRRRTELSQTWLALIPRFPHYQFHVSSLKNEMVPEFDFILQVWAEVTLSRLSHSPERGGCHWHNSVFVGAHLMENIEAYFSNSAGMFISFPLSFLLSLCCFLAVYFFLSLCLSLHQPGTDLVKHFKGFVIDYS